MPNYAKLRNQAVTTLPGGWKIFAGQADDPFFLDLRVFDLLYGGDLKEVGQDTLAGYNVNTIAIQVPLKDVALNGDSKRNPVIGVWSTADRPRVRITGKTTTSPNRWVQVSRLGNPLVNEVVVPANLADPGHLRHQGACHTAQRPGRDLPDRVVGAPGRFPVPPRQRRTAHEPDLVRPRWTRTPDTARRRGGSQHLRGRTGGVAGNHGCRAWRPHPAFAGPGTLGQPFTVVVPC
jgi:hypothetical protein